MGRRKDKETDTIKITNQEGLALATDPQPFDDGLAQLQAASDHLFDLAQHGSCQITAYHRDQVAFSVKIKLPIEGKIEDLISDLISQRQEATSLPATDVPVANETDQDFGPEPISTDSLVADTTPKRTRNRSRRTNVKKPKRAAIKLPSIALPKIRRSFLKHLITIAALLIMAGGFLFGTKLVVDAYNAPPTYAALIKKGSYLQAGKLYPERRDDVRKTLTSQSNVKQLAKFQRSYPKAETAFDLAYLQHNWPKVIKTSSQVTLSQERQIKLAVAYVHTKQFDAAELINEQLKSKTLSEVIALGYVHQKDFDKAQKINDNLKDSTIKQAIEVGKKYAAGIDAFSKIANDPQQLAEKRQQARDTVKTFEHALSTLGESRSTNS
ncbi:MULTISPECIES: hypothetical protein [Lacticaseibacillus]|uniref:hypothetical protein n=1 Tax=Lacticaseibacillus TaxID=2759736 RepID=UPI00066571AF|nr:MULTISPECIES: hypothetical protein [Lacticaseibacillus]OFP91155.1 hypothetical protein HMPREF2965_01735 [Lactobacillus sp. HMSC075D02]RNE16825.1 hypothetical protein FAM3257_03086 [Lacticaseibacillus paracasei]TLQ33780.1 hypothetical protein FEZ40_16095 [Lacticaseibacillus paracasei]URW92013.1 hypothetical protein NCY29_03105 [Lacticaseibacillus paracasei]